MAVHRAFGYFFREAVVNLARSWKISLVAVSKTIPADYTRTGVTGIDKRPVDGPLEVRPPGPKGGSGSGVAGDAIGDVTVHGGDYQAVVADLKTLLTPFYTANAGDNITVLMNPIQGLALSMMPGPGAAGEFGWADPVLKRLNIIESTNVTAGRLIALRTSDFATALGDAPEFDISETATVHMEDTTALEIVSTTPTTADPVRSFFQTATIGVRMLMDVSWKMRRSGMVSWIDGTTW